MRQKKLKQVHRVRQLEEEQARHAAQSAMAKLRVIERTIHCAVRAGGERQALRNSEMALPRVPEDCLARAEAEASIDRDWVGRTKQLLPPLHAAMTAARQEHMERRTARMKIESVLERAHARELVEQKRTEMAESSELYLICQRIRVAGQRIAAV